MLRFLIRRICRLRRTTFVRRGFLYIFGFVCLVLFLVIYPGRPSKLISIKLRMENDNSAQKRNLVNTELKPPAGNEFEHVSPRRSEYKKLRLLTMFTSFKNSTKRTLIEVNTVKNWASFIPDVQPVLFANTMDGELVHLAKDLGWKIHEIPRTNRGGLPILKDMYTEAFSHYDSYFTGFCNGDILFDDGLVTTLKGLIKYLDFLNSTMIIGRRENYWMSKNLTKPELLYRKDITHFLSHYTSFFSFDAEDYFFLSYHGFPWSKLKDVVIARPGYDNYFVAIAKRNNISVVDASRTILALHQTGEEGKRAGSRNKDGRYNKNLIGPFPYQKGTTNLAQYETHKDATNEVYITKRKLSKKQKAYHVPEEINKDALEKLQNVMYNKTKKTHAVKNSH